MGRRKKVLTELERVYRQKSAERVKALKDERHSTYKDLAESIGISEATIRNYAHQRSAMDSSVARLFQEYTGIIWPYWIGETDCRTWEEHQIEQFEAASEAYAEMQEEELQRIEQYKALFTVCGFQYENLALSPAYEFDPQAAAPHCIIGKNTPALSVKLNDTELNSLVDRLRAAIELECFLKSKQA